MTYSTKRESHFDWKATQMPIELIRPQIDHQYKAMHCHWGMMS